MASYGWGKDHSVEEWLLVETQRFDFYQAVRLLEQLHGEALSVGESPDPRKEAVRFCSKARLDFPASDLQELRPPQTPGGPAELVVNFLGTAGWFDPLPAVDTERLLERIAKQDHVLRDFLDVFHHRLISVFYRTRKQFHIGLDHRPPDQSHAALPLFALMGLGTPRMRGRMRVPDRALLHYAGIFAAEHRSMAGLEVMLRHYFEVPVEGRPFRGEWYQLDESQQTMIGKRGRNNRLTAQGATLGRRSWSQEAGIEIEIGPLPYKRYVDFLPVHRASVALAELTHFYVGESVSAKFRLILDGREVPATKLTQEDGPRLGWTSWLKTKEFGARNPEVPISPSALDRTRQTLPPNARRTLEPESGGIVLQ